MGSNLLGRLTVMAGVAAVVGLAAASPAWADTTVAVNPGNVPTTASAYGTPDCDENFGGGPYAKSDVWVFVLPGNQNKVGEFVSITATFGAHGTLKIPADGGAVVTDKGASKAWITTPAGWTLTDASAVITGTADKFNLTHTCPATGSGRPPTATPTPLSVPVVGIARPDRRHERYRIRQFDQWRICGVNRGRRRPAHHRYGGDQRGDDRRGPRGRRHRPPARTAATERPGLRRRGRPPGRGRRPELGAGRV
jgi:hypothetical protein